MVLVVGGCLFGGNRRSMSCFGSTANTTTTAATATATATATAAATTIATSTKVIHFTLQGYFLIVR